MTTWSRLRRLDERVLGSRGRRPTQRAVTRGCWALLTLAALLMFATAFDRSTGFAFGVVAFQAGLWSGRLQEATLAAQGKGIILTAAEDPAAGP